MSHSYYFLFHNLYFHNCSVDYDLGQQIALGTSATVPTIVPTYADCLAAFPTWQGQVALFVPNP